MQTCKIGSDKYFLKFSDEELFASGNDPSLQILVEYLAYSIYRLYPNVRIPQNVKLVFDKKNERVGLATAAIKGRPGLTTVSPKSLGRMLSAGIYVDVLLANWDVVGAGAGNIIIDKKQATRIDPGGALTFRAQGGRKGKAFSALPSELETMLDPDMEGGAGRVLAFADIKKAAKEFGSVSWGAIAETISEVDARVTSELKSNRMHGLLKQWKADVAEVKSKLAKRHAAILSHVRSTLALG